ncbi:MAG: hypothetical protein ABI723_26245 [Bacteroidia bacterium]
MPISRNDTPLTAAQATAIQAGIESIKSAFATQQVGLTPDERTSLSNLGDTRYPFGQRTITTHAVNNPLLVPPFKPLGRAADSLTLYNQFNTYLPQLVQLVELMSEAQQMPGHNVYEFTRAVYDLAKQGSAAGVPGADTIVQDIGELFAGQGNFNTPPPTPAP